MGKAEVVDVRFGTVQIEGEANIFKHDSRVHERDYAGLRFLEYGFLSLACMKLLYGLNNGNGVVDYFKDFKDNVFPLLEDFRRNTSSQLVAGVCFAWLRRSRPADQDSKIWQPRVDQFLNVASKKQKVHEELLSSNRLKK